MRVIVSTHQGRLYNEEAQYIAVKGNNNEFGIMENHVPVVAVLDEGYIKLENNDKEAYIVIISGIFEFHNNVASILAQEAHMGKSQKEAYDELLQIRKARLDQNRQEQTDFTQKEKELRENIKKSGAGSL